MVYIFENKSNRNANIFFRDKHQVRGKIDTWTYNTERTIRG